MTDHSKSGFPKHFLWGAASAAHQYEGDQHNQWTIWELENARALAAQAEYHISDYSSWDHIKDQAKSPHNYVSGMATDHYRRYKEDFDLLEDMNMNAFRFSIEWSRVEPEEGVWNPEAIAHYREYIRELKRRDIEPIVTLLHFTLPVWFAEKGGFLKKSNIKYFIRYVNKIMQELENELGKIITINEPEVYAAISYYAQMWPPAERNLYHTWRVAMNQMTAHNRAAKLIHKKSRRYKVSMAKHSIYFYPGGTSRLGSAKAKLYQYFEDDYLLSKVIKNCDFIALNYYQSMRTYGHHTHILEVVKNDLDWVLAPADIEFVLERLYKKYKKPILITENGVADAKDIFRKDWIKQTIVAMQAAMKKGVKIQGYLHWSLTDNFEWSYGRWPRFGLAEVDYKTYKRTLRPSAIWFGKVIKHLRGL
ncbi:MAG: beta-glucosidase [Candidatus Saccharibacteria bacterium]|nr:beta-glucosidase [Candidatus Saccharibacteria bacterium]